MASKKEVALQQVYLALAKRGIIRRCPKCGGIGAPCLYPDFNYRDCPVREERNLGVKPKA